MASTRFNHLLVIAALCVIVAAAAITPAESVSITFKVTYHLESGYGFVVAGNVAALGNWNVPDAPEMSWADGDVWSVVVDLTPETAIEFKLVEVCYDTKKCVCWDASGDKVLTVPTSSDTYDFGSFTCDTNSCDPPFDSCDSSQENAIKEDLTIKEVVSI